MTDPSTIRTERLELLPATEASLRAELDGPSALAAALGVSVPAAWPPELYDEAAIRWVLSRLEESTAYLEWGFRYFVLRGESEASLLIGAGGYKGPVDGSGQVEVGYSVLPEYQRQGYATEATVGLVGRAFRDPGVQAVVAETLPELVPSIGVLDRVGFVLVGEGSEPGVIRYELSRERWAARGAGRR